MLCWIPPPWAFIHADFVQVRDADTKKLISIEAPLPRLRKRLQRIATSWLGRRISVILRHDPAQLSFCEAENVGGTCECSRDTIDAQSLKM